MARAVREWVADAIYHVFSRGSNRQAIFLNDGDYREFEMIFASAVRKHELDCFGWSLMPNHWHGVLRCPPAGLSRLMKEVNHRYALRFDRRWGRTAHLFANRFGAVLQTTERQFLWTLRYVVRNPVEAGICGSPYDTRWTSFAATAGIAPAPEYLRVDQILDCFSADRDTARRRYIDFVVGVPVEFDGQDFSGLWSSCEPCRRNSLSEPDPTTAAGESIGTELCQVRLDRKRCLTPLLRPPAETASLESAP